MPHIAVTSNSIGAAMPKLFPIKIQAEEISVGPVLRLLHETAGVVKIDLDLGHAGPKPQADGQNTKATILALLMKGPASRDQIALASGVARTRLYSIISELKSKHLIKSIGKHDYALTEKAVKELGTDTPAVTSPLLALPAPARHKKGKRASPGVPRAALVLVLTQTPGLRTAQVRESLSRNGMSAKSISGVIDRAKKDTIIKKVGDGWQLTAKGQKLITATESANG
jgi:predicted transcriptional regulator